MSSGVDDTHDQVLFPITSGLEVIQFQTTLLEALFGDTRWFYTQEYKKQNHPAFRRWHLCRRLSEQGGCFSFPKDRAIVNDVSLMALDNFIISQSSGGQGSTFSLGSFANYGDEKVQKRIQREIWSPQGFLSLLTEFSYAASHILKGHEVTAFENEGYPDFLVISINLPYPIIADCKRIDRDTTYNRYSKLLYKIQYLRHLSGVDRMIDPPKFSHLGHHLINKNGIGHCRKQF